MSGANNSTTGYSIDTNIVLDLRIRRYPPDVFGTLWTRFESLIGDGRALVATEVAFELGRGDDDCEAWAKSREGFVVEADDDVVAHVGQIVQDFPEWSSTQTNWADPFVVAHAYARGWAVVTEERWSNSPMPERIKIPNVCDRYGVTCLNFVEFARAEGWHL